MFTRREFAQSLSGAIAIGTLKPVLRRASAPVQVSPEAARLYRTAFVLDCNALAYIGQLAGPRQEIRVKAVLESGLSAVKSTLGGFNGTFEETVADIAQAEHLIEKLSELFLKVRIYEDLERAKQQRKLGIIYSFEAPSMLGNELSRIELFRRLGVRVMQLTYNRRSPFGVGCLDGDAGGLTELGHQAIDKMNEIGVAVDLSHSNTQTTAEGIAASKRPPIMSHAGCRVIHNHPRNKEDREMKALGNKGGVMGIYMLPYLTPSPKQPTLEDYMRHLEHALKTCGEDHVGVGSDVQVQTVTGRDIERMSETVEQRKAAGISAPGEDRPPYIPDLNTPRKMEIIGDSLLKRGYGSRVAEKVLGANFRRVFGEIWAASS